MDKEKLEELCSRLSPEAAREIRKDFERMEANKRSMEEHLAQQEEELNLRLRISRALREFAASSVERGDADASKYEHNLREGFKSRGLEGPEVEKVIDSMVRAARLASSMFIVKR